MTPSSRHGLYNITKQRLQKQTSWLTCVVVYAGCAQPMVGLQSLTGLA